MLNVYAAYSSNITISSNTFINMSAEGYGGSGYMDLTGLNS